MEDNILKGLTDISEKMDNSLGSIEKRLEAVEAAAARPAVAKSAESEKNEVKSLFAEYLRNPEDNAKKFAFESKAVTVAGNTNAVPRTISDDVIAAARNASPFVNLVLKKTGITPEFSQMTSNGSTVQLVGESTVRTEQTATLGAVKPVFAELASTISLSKQAIEDYGINVVDEITAMIAADFAVAMEQYLVTGSGTGVQNAGLLLGGTGVNLTVDPTVEDVLALIKSVKVNDAAQGAFVVSPEIYALLSDEKVSGQRIIDIKDSVDMIRGKPVYQSEFLTEANPAVFGNFKRGFLAATHAAGMEFLVNPYKTAGFVDIQARLRFGSAVMHSGAYAKLVVA